MCQAFIPSFSPDGERQPKSADAVAVSEDTLLLTFEVESSKFLLIWYAYSVISKCGKHKET